MAILQNQEIHAVVKLCWVKRTQTFKKGKTFPTNDEDLVRKIPGSVKEDFRISKHPF